MDLLSFAIYVGAATVFRLFFFFPEEFVLYIAVDSMSVGQRSPGFSYVTNLNWNLLSYRNGFVRSINYIVYLHIEFTDCETLKKSTVKEFFYNVIEGTK